MKHVRLFAWLTGLVSVSVAASQNTVQLAKNPCPSPVMTQASLQSTPAKTSNELLPQPLNPTLQGLAPKNARVDLKKPTFSNPTMITHPLFPTGKVFKTLLLGKVDGLVLHVEYTLLPIPKVFQWNGQTIKALEVQYAAHLNGRVKELALDWYAQADDGSVWYFGEDVFNYEQGSAADTKGTWRAGRDGTPAMIMPANLQVGKAFRVENIPGVAFEEITIKATDATVYGPNGSIKGAMVGRQLHMDGSYSNKTFAPNYGEFVTITDTEHEALALAIPTDALECSVPTDLETLSSGAIKIFDTVRPDAWAQASNQLEAMIAAWNKYQQGDVPAMLDAQMSDALVVLTAAVNARQHAEARQTALNVAQASLDLEFRYRPLGKIEVMRSQLWTRQLVLDAARKNYSAIKGDVTTLEWLWQRFAHTLEVSKAKSISLQLVKLRSAANAGDLATTIKAVAALQTMLAELNSTIR